MSTAATRRVSTARRTSSVCAERLDQAAVARRIRPGVEPAAAAVRSLGCPHLLEGRPVVGGALAAEDRAAVRPLELNVHLQAPEVGWIWSLPAPPVPWKPSHLL